MYHEHPLRILKYSAKNIWLLIFPFIRGLRTYHFSKDFFYAWIQGAWKDILVICVIILFGFIRWFFSRIEVNDDMLIHHDGVFIKLDTFIPFDNIRSASCECSDRAAEVQRQCAVAERSLAQCTCLATLK